MYQWVENIETKTEKKTGGSKKTTKTASYAMQWKSSLQNSSKFMEPKGHTNPTSIPYAGLIVSAKKITTGAFTLNSSLKNDLNKWEAFKPATGHAATLRKTIANISDYKNGFYIGKSAGTPVVGDVRIAFEVVKPYMVSICAKQIEDTFEPLWRAMASRSSCSMRVRLVRN